MILYEMYLPPKMQSTLTLFNLHMRLVQTSEENKGFREEENIAL